MYENVGLKTLETLLQYIHSPTSCTPTGQRECEQTHCRQLYEWWTNELTHNVSSTICPHLTNGFIIQCNICKIMCDKGSIMPPILQTISTYLPSIYREEGGDLPQCHFLSHFLGEW